MARILRADTGVPTSSEVINKLHAKLGLYRQAVPPPEQGVPGLAKVRRIGLLRRFIEASSSQITFDGMLHEDVAAGIDARLQPLGEPGEVGQRMALEMIPYIEPALMGFQQRVRGGVERALTPDELREVQDNAAAHFNDQETLRGATDPALILSRVVQRGYEANMTASWNLISGLPGIAWKRYGDVLDDPQQAAGLAMHGSRMVRALAQSQLQVFCAVINVITSPRGGYAHDHVLFAKRGNVVMPELAESVIPAVLADKGVRNIYSAWVGCPGEAAAPATHVQCVNAAKRFLLPKFPAMAMKHLPVGRWLWEVGKRRFWRK